MSFLVVANWKANGDLQLASEFLHSLCSHVSSSYSDKVEVVFCPPFVAMPLALSDSSLSLSLGGQNCYHEKDRGCTGEITAEMLRRCGCGYVVLGHSDRRLILGEKDCEIKQKALCAIAAGIRPIICVGETLEERNAGVSGEALTKQCNDCLPTEGEFFVAYEPVWAIGGSEIPDLELISESFDVIRSYRSELRILYGGSVNEKNIRALALGISGIAGVLVGSASLSSRRFCDMIDNLEKCL